MRIVFTGTIATTGMVEWKVGKTEWNLNMIWTRHGTIGAAILLHHGIYRVEWPYVSFRK
jgi:hypothetical protein